MSTVEKERQVISRAVRVLDEIESRIHELREELEQGGVSTVRGKKGQRDGSHDGPDEGNDDNGRVAQGRTRSAGSEGRPKAKSDHEEAGSEQATQNDEHEPHAQGKVKHPETDRRLKNGKGDHEEAGHGSGQADAPDDEHEPHAQGKVKHPETDRRLKANKE